MARILDSLGRFCARNRRWVFAVWAAVAVATVALGAAGGGTFVQQDRLPGTETQRSIDLLRHNFADVTGPTATIVFHPQPGVSMTDWRVAVQVGKAIEQVGELPRVATVENPYGGTGGAKGKNAVVAVAHLKGTARDLGPGDMRALEEATEPARLAGVDVDLRRHRLADPQPAQGRAPRRASVSCWPSACSCWPSGRFLAAGVPIVVSLAALAVAYSLIHFGASLLQVHPTAPMVAAMLGLGAGIDYALFVVTRLGGNSDDGMDGGRGVHRCSPGDLRATPWSSPAARSCSSIWRAVPGRHPASVHRHHRLDERDRGGPAGTALTLLPAVLGARSAPGRSTATGCRAPGPTGRGPLGALGRHWTARLAVRDRRHAAPALARRPGSPAVRHHGRQHAAARRQRPPRRTTLAAKEFGPGGTARRGRSPPAPRPDRANLGGAGSPGPLRADERRRDRGLTAVCPETDLDDLQAKLYAEACKGIDPRAGPGRRGGWPTGTVAPTWPGHGRDPRRPRAEATEGLVDRDRDEYIPPAAGHSRAARLGRRRVTGDHRHGRDRPAAHAVRRSPLWSGSRWCCW